MKKFFFIIKLSLIIMAISTSMSIVAQTGNNIQHIESNKDGEGLLMTIRFDKGEAHNHPLMVVWVESEDSTFIETLFVSESIGKGVFKHAVNSSGKWISGEIERPSALPYWGHKRGIKSSHGNFVPDKEHPEVDAVTGATPSGSFELSFHLTNCPAGNCRILMEINQSWDWNNYWTNSRINDPEYHASAQPSVIYEAIADPRILPDTIEMKPIGRGDETGKSGKLYPDLETLTTALKIAKKITLIVGQ